MRGRAHRLGGISRPMSVHPCEVQCDLRDRHLRVGLIRVMGGRAGEIKAIVQGAAYEKAAPNGRERPKAQRASL